MRLRLLAILAVSAAVLALPIQARAGDLFAGQFGEGGTSWNVYELVSGIPQSWADAYSTSIPSLTDPTGGSATGHLATITDATENAFLASNISGSTWIGLTDREGVGDGTWLPEESQTFAPNQQTFGWAWVDDTPFVYANWNASEPNDAGGGEDAVELLTDGLWNDNEIGWDVDLPVAATIQPGTSTQEDAITRAYLIEWETRLPSDPTGTFPATRPDPPALPLTYSVFPAGPMPGFPAGAAGMVGVREVRDIGSTGTIVDAVANITGGTGTIFDGQVATIDLTDPDTNAGGGPALGGTPIPFISDAAGVDDENIQTIIKGRVFVPPGQGGTYSVRVHSDDGFAVRFLDVNGNAVPFTEAAEAGRVDQDGALVFPTPTGDSNSRGIVTLASNAVYDVEFVAYENGGGAYWELTTVQGDYRDDVGQPNQLVYVASWVGLGGQSVVKQSFQGPAPVKLVGPAAVTTVNNMTGQDIGNVPLNIADARAGGILPPEDVFDSTVTTVALLNTAGGSGAGTGALQGAGLQNPFPNDSGGDDDNFETGVTGRLSVDDGDGNTGETLTLTVAMFSDDNAYFQITGEDFDAVMDTNGNTISELIDITGDGTTGIAYNDPTGNTNTYGLITIDEGEYDFEGYMLEIDGGAFYEIWVAEGNHMTDGFVAGEFWPLTTLDLTQQIVGNTALELVDPDWVPSSADPGDFDGDGDIDGDDFLIWQASFGTDDGGDADNDGDTDGDDFLIWQAGFGSGNASGAVPEPASVLLLCLAAMAIGTMRRRK